MPAPDITKSASPPRASNRRNRRPWWKRLMRAMGMGGPQEHRPFEPFRPDVAMELTEAALRREQELRQGLRQRIAGIGKGTD